MLISKARVKQFIKDRTSADGKSMRIGEEGFQGLDTAVDKLILSAVDKAKKAKRVTVKKDDFE